MADGSWLFANGLRLGVGIGYLHSISAIISAESRPFHLTKIQ